MASGVGFFCRKWREAGDSEDVEDGVAAPGVGVFAEEGGVVGGGVGAGDAVAVATEGFELVDEFVDDVPGPEVLLIC